MPDFAQQLPLKTGAPLQSRVIAGAIDTVILVLLSCTYFVVPMWLRGVVLPMWGVLAAMVGYAVVPLAFLKQTFGMRLFGLELVTRDGHPVDFANLLFRELVGRGFFPAAYLFTLVASFIAALLRVAASSTPPLLGGLMTLACGAAVVVAVAGHLMALGRPDGRTLADLLARSFVVIGPARPLPQEDEERREYFANRRRVVRNIAIFEVVLMLSVVALPTLLTMPGGESPQARIARLKREGLEKKFHADPGNEALAAELQQEYWRAGRDDDAKQVAARHFEARRKRDASREVELRRVFAEKKDRANASALVELLEDQDRIDDAAVVYREYVAASPEPSTRAGFGHWLASVGRTEAAIVELERAVREDPLVAFGHTMLGVCYQRAGRLDDARRELVMALEDDPEDEDAVEALTEVERAIGPIADPEKRKLTAMVKAWKRDAGVE